MESPQQIEDDKKMEEILNAKKKQAKVKKTGTKFDSATHEVAKQTKQDQ